MADDEVLRRIDRSLERIDGHMERGNRFIEDHRVFTRDLVRRHERVTNEMVRALTEQTTAIREERREFVAEMRAQRCALFRILDRLDGGDAPAGA